MAWCETKSEPLALRAFRWAAPVVLEREGSTLSGRGAVSPLRQETGEPGAKRHQVGALARPLYRFVGWLPSPDEWKGGVLTQGTGRWTVLDVKPMILGGCQLCVRALLEEKGE